MGNNKKKALFIVDSAFQVLCASEAILHYSIEEVHYALEEDDVVKQMTLPLIKAKGIIHIIKKNKKEISTIEWIKNTKKAVVDKFNLIFIGDYYSYWQYVVATCISNFCARFIYLDDGNSTLSIIPPESRKRGSGRGRVWFKVLDVYNNVRFIKQSLFTVFNLGDNSPIPYEMHSFSSLIEINNEEKVQDGIYVIGINTEKILLKDRSYTDYLSLLDKYIKVVSPDVRVFYCPHRMDPTDYSEYIRFLGWSLFNTEYSVEIDFVNRGIIPRIVIGFGSTALFTLKMMFKDSQVCTVYMDFVDDTYNVSYRAIENYYESFRIPTIKLF